MTDGKSGRWGDWHLELYSISDLMKEPAKARLLKENYGKILKLIESGEHKELTPEEAAIWHCAAEGTLIVGYKTAGEPLLQLAKKNLRCSIEGLRQAHLAVKEMHFRGIVQGHLSADKLLYCPSERRITCLDWHKYATSADFQTALHREHFLFYNRLVNREQI